MVVILNTWFTEDKPPCNGLSFCILVYSIVIVIKIFINRSSTGSFHVPPCNLVFHYVTEWKVFWLETVQFLFDPFSKEKFVVHSPHLDKFLT
jgi:hypothetical protein